VDRPALLRTLRRPLVEGLRRLDLLEPARWLRMVGVRAAARELRYRALGAPDKLPLPPRSLHELIVGTDRLTIHDYLWIGRGCADILLRLVREHDASLRTLEPALDFGCGCGRVMRHLWAAEPGLRIWGTDINTAQIAWCRAHLPFAAVEVNGPAPPLPFSGTMFGLAYAFSVFTHLPAELQRPWLLELVRVLRPGGYLVLSFHGAAFASRLPPDERARFEAGDLVVRRPEDANLPDRYATCAAYHPAAYVADTFALGLTILAHVPGEILDSARQVISQDVYLFRKPL